MSFNEFFGETLVNKSGQTAPTSEVLAGKDAVLIYFSAHWCPPCRRFTPELAKFYLNHSAAKNFEVVFASSDRDEASFKEYLGEMPWHAIPFSERQIKTKLSQQYGVQGIPMLVVVDSQGALITKNGREKVSVDAEAAEFPWNPKPFHEVLGDSFINKSMAPVDKTAIEGKTLGIYFSAHWCPPCRQFTPKLAQFYKEYKEQDQNFEIVFASSDKDEGSFKEYFTTDHGDWLALPFADRKRKEELSSLFEVEGIPTFVVVGADGAVLNANARGKISAGAAQVIAEGWKPAALGDLEQGPEAAGFDVNQKPSLIAFIEGCDDQYQGEIVDVLKPMAKEFAEDPKGPKMIFLTARTDCDMSQRIRDLTKLDKPKDVAQIVILDIPSQGAYYKKDLEDVTTENIKTLIQEFEAGKLERHQLQ